MAAADRKLAKQLPLPAVDRIAKESEEVVALIEGGQQRTSALTGEALPSPQQLARVRKQNLLRSFKERHRLLADTLTVREVCDLLGVSRQTPHDRVHAGTLVAIRDNGQLRFPAWQFDSEGPDGVVEGLPEVLQAMRGPISPLSKIKWFLTPKALMGERTPLDALRQGDVENAVAEARTIGAS